MKRPDRRPFARPGRRTAQLVATFLVITISGTGCEVKADGEDARRVAKLRSYELLQTAPAGATLTRKPGVSGAKQENPQAGDGGNHDGSAAWTTTQSLAATAHFYADALVKQGWQDVQAYCSGPPPAGRGSVRIDARRKERGYNTSASVELLRPRRDATAVEITAFVHAPFHTVRDTAPAGKSPDLSCIDRMPAD